jgi:hypothetical protein
VQIHDRCQTQHSCRFQGDKWEWQQSNG